MINQTGKKFIAVNVIYGICSRFQDHVTVQTNSSDLNKDHVETRMY